MHDRTVEVQMVPEVASDLIETLRHTMEWIDNLERRVGNVALMDNCPNGFGRPSIRHAIRMLDASIIVKA
jgi:hypothetical protein